MNEAENFKNKARQCEAAGPVALALVAEDAEVVAPCTRAPYYPLVVRRGRGATVEDVDGNSYIDFVSSAAVCNTGHAHPKVVAAIQDQAARFIHYTTAYMYHEPMIRLAKTLTEISPGAFKKNVMFGLSGSDANDGMIKAARAFTGRSKIISFEQAYHGSTYGSLSLTAISPSLRRKIGPLLPDVHHFPYPDCYRCAYRQHPDRCGLECLHTVECAFQHYLPAEEVAAVIIEPIAGDAGFLVPPPRYLEGLYALCQRNGILFAVDEVQQGFGRTGRWFSIEHYGIVPDMIAMAKSMASGMPLSAVVAREEILRALGRLSHAFTTAANPVCCAAALATIEVLREEGLLLRAEELGRYLKTRLEEFRGRFPVIGEVRGIGLSLGVDLVTDVTTKARNADAAGKIVYRCW